jgi:hypothetical protein
MGPPSNWRLRHPSGAFNVSHIVLPGSVLASTAAELLARHSAATSGDGSCPACGSPAPCPVARHADAVLAATPDATAVPAPPLWAAA